MTAAEALRKYSVALRDCVATLDKFRAARSAEERANAQASFEAAQVRVDDARTRYDSIQKSAARKK